jgi:hypothetical protein
MGVLNKFVIKQFAWIPHFPPSWSFSILSEMPNDPLPYALGSLLREPSLTSDLQSKAAGGRFP